MKCYIRTIDRKIRLVPCYKTKYKNVVIAKVEEKSYVDIYSITHYPTGIALSLDRFVIIKFDYDINIEMHLSKNNKELVDFIRTLRSEAKTNGIRATFSYRCISMVTKLESVGLSLKDILEIAVFKGMEKDTINNFRCYNLGINKYKSAMNELQRVA